VDDRLSRVSGLTQLFPTHRLPVVAAKTADLILIMLDATKSEEQRRLLEIELDAVGIRLNKQKPDVVFKKRTTGGSVYFAKVDLCHLLTCIGCGRITVSLYCFS
jgi:uncharacterized protein